MFPDAVVENYSCEKVYFFLYGNGCLRTLSKELNTKTNNKKSLKFKTIHIYSQVAESHINQAIHDLQCIQYVRFQTVRKSPLAVSDNSGHFVLHHSTIHIIQKPLASSFIFREPSQMQVETQGTIVNTTKSVLISGSLGRAAVKLSWCSAPAGASTWNGADIQGAQAGCRRGHRGSGHWACAHWCSWTCGQKEAPGDAAQGDQELLVPSGYWQCYFLSYNWALRSQ